MSDYTVQIPEFRASRGVAWLKERGRLLRGIAPGLLRHRMAGFDIICDSVYSPAAMLGAVAEHCSAVAAGTLLKDDVKRRLSRSNVNGMPVVVKEYRRLHRIRCFSPDQRGWLGARRLHGSCRAIGWLRAWDSSVAYQIMEDVGSRDLILKNEFVNAPEADALFYAAGKLLAGLHNAGIYHADFKASNIVISGGDSGEFRLELIDCDDVRCCRISTARCAKNLAQFLGVQWFVEDFERRLQLSRQFVSGYAASRRCPVAKIGRAVREIPVFSSRIYPEQVEIMEEIVRRLGEEW